MLTVKDVSMNFSGQPCFKDVDLSLRGVTATALSARNGAGKSTFLRILSGESGSRQPAMFR